MKDKWLDTKLQIAEGAVESSPELNQTQKSVIRRLFDEIRKTCECESYAK